MKVLIGLMYTKTGGGMDTRKNLLKRGGLCSANQYNRMICWRGMLKFSGNYLSTTLAA